MIEKYLNNRFVSLYFLPFIIGCSTVFSFQPYNLTFINFFVLPIIFYLIVYIKKKSKSTYRKKPYRKNLFIFGTVFGFGFYFSGIYWISNSLTFDESFKVLIPFSLILIPLFLSLFFSLIILLTGPFLNLNLSSLLLFSGTLAFSDYLRSKILTGFPWNLWAYSFSWSTEIIQVLNLIGLFAFNTMIITIFMLPAVLFFRTSILQKFYYFSLLLFIISASYIYGDYSINNNISKLKHINKSFKIKVISPNFDLEYGLSETKIKKRLANLIKFSEPNLDEKTLFVWPEGVFSGYSYNEVLVLKEAFAKNFGSNQFILFGINRLDIEKNKFYNSLVVVNNKMEIIQEYKKQKLVPFGEFIPFEKIIEKFGLKKITEGYGSFLKASKQENLKIDELNILPLICYEVIFTELIQKSNKNTNLIINISEDGWFGNSIGPYQHFAKGIYRAIENDSFLIRSANRGISAIINNKGQIIKKLNPSEVGNIELDVPLVENQNKSKNDLIFFMLLITYIFVFNKKNNVR